MLESSRRNFILGLVLPLTVSACGKQPEPEQVARKFMESYYINMSLKEAQTLSMGLAKEKLENQIRLLDGQSITAGTNVPKVDIHLLSSEPGQDGEVSFIFEVTPRAQDVGKRKVYVKVRQENGRWLISQFTESDQALP
jgi:hypothetical protein